MHFTFIALLAAAEQGGSIRGGGRGSARTSGSPSSACGGGTLTCVVPIAIAAAVLAGTCGPPSSSHAASCALGKCGTLGVRCRRNLYVSVGGPIHGEVGVLKLVPLMSFTEPSLSGLSFDGSTALAGDAGGVAGAAPSCWGNEWERAPGAAC